MVIMILSYEPQLHVQTQRMTCSTCTDSRVTCGTDTDSRVTCSDKLHAAAMLPHALTPIHSRELDV